MQLAPAPPPVGVRPPADHIQGLSRGLRILEHVHSAGRPVGVKEVSAAVGLNLSTVYHLVNTLLYEGYLVRTADRLLQPGRLPGEAAATQTAGVRRALGRAAYAVDDVAVLARLDGAHTCVAECAEVPQAPSGGHYPQHAMSLSHLLAVGRVLIAHQPPEHTERLIELTRRAAAVREEVFDEAELRNDLRATAERGYCALIGEGDACVAVPVLDGRGWAQAAVAVVVPVRRLRHELGELVAASLAAAQEVEAALDARPELRRTDAPGTVRTR